MDKYNAEVRKWWLTIALPTAIASLAIAALARFFTNDKNTILPFIALSFGMFIGRGVSEIATKNVFTKNGISDTKKDIILTSLLSVSFIVFWALYTFL